jgi:hypothetical protein
VVGDSNIAAMKYARFPTWIPRIVKKVNKEFWNTALKSDQALCCPFSAMWFLQYKSIGSCKLPYCNIKHWFVPWRRCFKFSPQNLCFSAYSSVVVYVCSSIADNLQRAASPARRIKTACRKINILRPINNFDSPGCLILANTNSGSNDVNSS